MQGSRRSREGPRTASGGPGGGACDTGFPGTASTGRPCPAVQRPLIPAVMVVTTPSSRVQSERSRSGQGSIVAATAAGRSSRRRRQGDFGGASVRAARLAEPGSPGAAAVRRCASSGWLAATS